MPSGANDRRFVHFPRLPFRCLLPAGLAPSSPSVLLFRVNLPYLPPMGNFLDISRFCFCTFNRLFQYVC